MTTTFHPGEIAIQTRVGETNYAEQNVAMISDEIAPGALRFLGTQKLAVVSSHDTEGSIWVTPFFGPAGFIQTRDSQHFDFDLSQMQIDEEDPVWSNLMTSPEIGMVAIELQTRKRFRVNGSLTRSAHRLSFEVAEAYPNCPKFIQRRQETDSQSAIRDTHSNSTWGIELTPEAMEVIRWSDSAFVGSRHPERSASDASHRGGPKGFIQVLDAHTLRVPDYPGNGLFNTLGNLTVDPKAGLLIIDFDSRRMLQLTGTATIRWDLVAGEEATLGTGRVWDFRLDQFRLSDLPTTQGWSLVQESPYNPSRLLY